jgi:Glycosyl hydrolases family 18
VTRLWRWKAAPAWVRRLVAGLGVLVLLLVLAAAAAQGTLIAEDSGVITPAAHSMGDDALWMGHAWVNGQDGQTDLNALVARLKKTGIRDLFVHSGPLSGNGTLNPALRPKARWLVISLHKALPGVRVQAWLGDIAGSGNLNLESTVTRDAITRSVRQVLADGFDGVHLDLEPINTGDPGYLALLSQVHAVTQAKHKLLSVAAEPVAGLGLAQSWLPTHWWSTSYLHQVAIRVDEVAIMTYNSPLPTSGAYAGYVRWETGLALAAVPPDVTLLIGAPAYDTGGPWPFSSAESIAGAIRGVQLAISPVPPKRPLGIALYVDFTATAHDWTTYINNWVH